MKRIKEKKVTKTIHISLAYSTGCTQGKNTDAGRDNLPRLPSTSTCPCGVYQEGKALDAFYPGHFSGLCVQQVTLREQYCFPREKSRPISAVYVHAKALQSCLTLCNPMDASPPGSSVPGILQARVLVLYTVNSPKLRVPFLYHNHLYVQESMIRPLPGIITEAKVH